MRRCRWPRGCEQWAVPDEETCTYHGKIVAGLIDVGEKFGPPAQADGGPERAGHTSEQFETAEILKAMGASSEVIRRLVGTAPARRGPRQKVRTGRTFSRAGS